MVRHGFDLVYGGAGIGVMGSIADAILECGGHAYGVMPQSLVEREIAHQGLTELTVTGSMHERKTRMADMSDAFVAMPGGLGTLEELFEMWTWAQLGLHDKAVGLLNVDGFFDQLLGFLDKATNSGFIKPVHRDILLVENDADALLQRIRDFKPVQVDKLA